MATVPFFQKFPELAASETRSVTVVKREPIPAGEYGFLEFYCDDAKCDCRRVIIRVIRRGMGMRIWATITYGWESVEFYRQWSKSGIDANEMAGAGLEPLSPQSPYSKAFLSLFEEIIAKDRAYLERLKRHYSMCKVASGRLDSAGIGIEQWRRMNRAAARAERRRARRGRG